MDGVSLRQSFTDIPVAPARVDTAAPRGAVETDLPATQTVASAFESGGTNASLSSGTPRAPQQTEAGRPREDRYERDGSSSDIVFKRINPDTGEVILQIPDESLLNLRAYLRQQEDDRVGGLMVKKIA